MHTLLNLTEPQDKTAMHLNIVQFMVRVNTGGMMYTPNTMLMNESDYMRLITFINNCFF